MNSCHIAALGRWHVNYRVQGNGPSLILLHGGSPGTSGETYYARNIDALSRHFTLYVLDFPGWGASSKNLLPEAGWANPLEQAGEVVSAFIEHLKLDRPHLLGSSFGAAAALYHAMKHPDWLGKLVLVSPGGGRLDNGMPFSEGVVKLMGYYLGEGPSRTKFDDLVRQLTHDPEVFPESELSARFAASRDPAVIENPPLRLPPSSSQVPAPLCDDPRLSELQADVLFVWGRQDKVQPLACLDSFKAIPNQELMLFNRCGHLPSAEFPERFNSLVTTFLRTH